MRDPQHDQSWQPSGFAIIALAVIAVPIFGVMAIVTRSIGPASIPIWFAVAGGITMILRGPIGQAIGRSIGGPTPNGIAEVPNEVYAELDELRARVAELEERVDFSERLLTKQGDMGAPGRITVSGEQQG